MKQCSRQTDRLQMTKCTNERTYARSSSSCFTPSARDETVSKREGKREDIRVDREKRTRCERERERIMRRKREREREES